MRCELPGLAALLLALTAACEPAPLPDDEPYEGGAEPPACVPNNDGAIDASELAFVPGVIARYRIAEGPLEVDVRGRVGDGERVWDFTTPAPEEEPLARLAASTMEGLWFEDEFPAASLAGPSDPGGHHLLPLSVDNDGVWMHGLASTKEAPPSGKTLAVYDEPLLLYPFPLHEGVKETTTALATGALLYGLQTAFEDRLEVEVTGRGTVRLPHLVLENTLRVTLRLERTLLAGDARQVTHVFLHECLGEVARVASPLVPLADVIADDFETAESVWRLSL